MKRPRPSSRPFVFRLTVALFLLAASLEARPGQPGEAPSTDPASRNAGFLRWRKSERRVDADLKGWTLAQALERVAAGTGWSVFVEPGLETRVAARFTNRPEREALAALLGDVNYALLPSTNGGSQLLVFRSVFTRATLAVKPAAPANDPRALDRELIVRLKKGATNDIATLARRLGARVTGSLNGLDAHRLVFDDAEAADRARASLANDENVEGVESNYALGAPSQLERLPGANVSPLGLKARPVSDGSSVIVALLDTAVSPAATTHADFLLPGVSVAGDAPSDGGLAHGPAMFETLLQGLAISQTSTSQGQPIRVLPVDVYGARGETTTFELAQGIVAALERGADIINLSLTGPNPSPVLHDVLQQAATAGVVAFAAPGNEPTTAPNYPAAYPEVVAVTASDRQGELASYANRGSYVDLIAPGTSLVQYGGDAWVVNGTSVSTAYASGLAAGLLADSGRPMSEILAQLRSKIGFNPPSTPTTGQPKP